MMPEWPPFLYFIIGAILLAVLPKRIQGFTFPVFPLLSLLVVSTLPEGTVATTEFYQYTLVLCEIDELNRIFGWIFSFIALAGGVYAFHLEDKGERVATLLYAGGALGVTFAGDFFTLLLFWELMAIASTFLIWARRNESSRAAGIRYLLVHLFGGSLLLAGIVLHLRETNDLSLTALTPVASLSSGLIFFGIAVNAAIVPLHAWLVDGYPKASVTGAVFLSAFTTKSAVYVLARLLPGWEPLIGLGVLMVVWGSVYGLLVNDIREILAYSTISQVGYMVAGVGIGTGLALNGVAAHAFCHIIYKALLFMGAGVVLHATGKSKLTELGGLAREMKWVMIFYLVGGLAISGAPLLNGFISKSMIISAAHHEHITWAQWLLLLGSAGTFLHTGLRLPYFTWIKPGPSVPVQRPVHKGMLAGMGLLAFGCLLLGVAPALLYHALPHAEAYHPYTIPHLVETVQLLLATFVVFYFLKSRLAGERAVVLDTDWFYRKPGATAGGFIVRGVNQAFAAVQAGVDQAVTWTAKWARNPVSLQDWTRPDRQFDPDVFRTRMGNSITLTLLVMVAVALWIFL